MLLLTVNQCIDLQIATLMRTFLFCKTGLLYVMFICCLVLSVFLLCSIQNEESPTVNGKKETSAAAAASAAIIASS